jgi:hypothetical protein
MKITWTAGLIAALAASNVALATALILDRDPPAHPNEVFADSIDQLRFDGRVMHVDLAQARIKLTEGQRPSRAERDVVARVVLTTDAASLLYAGMTKVFAARPPEQTAAQSL